MAVGRMEWDGCDICSTSGWCLLPGEVMWALQGRHTTPAPDLHCATLLILAAAAGPPTRMLASQGSTLLAPPPGRAMACRCASLAPS